MWRVLILLAGIALSGSTLVAQQAPGRPLILLAGGVAGQYDGGRDLGSPGLSAAIGLQWTVLPAVGIRLEAQGSEYGSQSLPAIGGVRGSAERLGAISTLVSWTPRSDVRLYLLGGGALARASVTGAGGTTTGAAVLGAGMPVVRYAGVEVQYLHAARKMGETRSALAARIQFQF